MIKILKTAEFDEWFEKLRIKEQAQVE
ncbi:MAG: hypothetical protein K940chlam2_00275, partial [Chlamydiae bacterium]|nr:hypothetical protein [Chlamydiota bacterium]